jgi:hypothetical protein
VGFFYKKEDYQKHWKVRMGAAGLGVLLSASLPFADFGRPNGPNVAAALIFGSFFLSAAVFLVRARWRANETPSARRKVMREIFMPPR